MAKPKEFAQASWSIFTEAMEILSLNQKGLCEILGYSHTAASTWRHKNSIPKVAAVAINGLVRDRVSNLKATPANGQLSLKVDPGYIDPMTHPIPGSIVAVVEDKPSSTLVLHVPGDKALAIMAVLDSMGIKYTEV